MRWDNKVVIIRIIPVISGGHLKTKVNKMKRRCELPQIMKEKLYSRKELRIMGVCELNWY